MVKGTIVEINSSDSGSTGNIMHMIADAARENGYICYTSCPVRRKKNQNKKKYHIVFDSLLEKKIHIILGKLTGMTGCFSVFDTFIFLKRMNVIKPDIIHLHNIHGSYLCLPMLFRYIKKNNIAMVWTFHDCWAFTGRCPHFQISNCDNWKNGCKECKYPHQDYPEVYINQAHRMWKLKRTWFCGIKMGVIVAPSSWIEYHARMSFLKEYPINIIRNGINLDIFKIQTNKEKICLIRRKYGIGEDEFVVLGVASIWNYKKGFDVFLQLAKRLEDKYRIVLVGVDSANKQQLPNRIMALDQINNPKDLADVYSMSDVFVNPTREETFSLVNIEALACGTPVITFDSGGSPECIDDTCGCVVEKDDISKLMTEITDICEKRLFQKEDCAKRAQSFDRRDMCQEYINLYSRLMSFKNSF